MGNGCSKKRPKEVEELYPQFVRNGNVKANGTVGNGAIPNTVIPLPMTQSIVGGSTSPNGGARPRMPGPSSSSPPPPASSSSGYGSMQGVDYDALEKETQLENFKMLKEDFKTNPKQFLVNQLLLSVQFFKNFEKDKESYRSMKADTEEQMQEALAQWRQRAIVSNAMYHKILDNLGFKSSEQDNVLEQILPTEYYISYEFVETNRKEDYERLANGSMEYSQVDEPYYRTCIEESGKSGFSKVRCVDDVDTLIVEEVEVKSDPGSFRPVSPRPPVEERIAPLEKANLEKPATLAGPKYMIDKFPSPINTHAKLNFNSKFTSSAIVEDEEDDESPPMTGSDLLRSIQGRLAGGGGGAGPGTANVFGPRPTRSPQRSPIPNNKQPFFPPSANGPSSNNASGNGATKKPPPPLDLSETGKLSKSNSVTSLTEDGYGYVTTRGAKNLSDVVGAGFVITKHNALPSKCFKRVEVPIVEDDLGPYPPAGEDREKMTKVYLSSRSFMQHFNNQFYELSTRIGKGHLPSGARVLDPRVMCHEERPTEGSFAKESSLDFIPTVEVGFWPDEGIEWYLRKRRRVRERRTNTIYQWPSAEIVSQAQQVGCNLVPVGFVDSRKSKLMAKDLLEATMQWEIQFTKLEQLIQKNLNHPKIRCLLFSLVLFKTFVSHLNSVSPQHIRYLFYWLVENAPAGWVEEQLGMKLLHLLKEMKSHLMSNRLPHYFISKSNMFEALPKHKLLKAQEVFHRLHENLVPYLMVSIKRLHIDKFFYPLPDVDELYNILTTTDTLAMLNPSLLQTTGGATNAFDRNKQMREMARSAKSTNADPAQERMRELHRRRIQEQNANLRSKQEEERETINLHMNVDYFDENRGRLVLEFFIGHFISLAKKSNEFSSHGQSLMFIRQADNLMKLLVELKFYGTSAHMGFQTELEQLKQVSRGTSRDYWNISWGPEERSGGGLGGGLGGMGSFRGGPGGSAPMQHHLLKVQSDPLPRLPSNNPSPILGVDKDTPPRKFKKQTQREVVVDVEPVKERKVAPVTVEINRPLTIIQVSKTTEQIVPAEEEEVEEYESTDF